MLVENKRFDGTTTYIAGHRRLPSFAGNAIWVPTYTPRSFAQCSTIRRLLTTFHRHNMRCFLTGTFAMFTAGILNSFGMAVVFVTLTDVNARLVDVIFQRIAEGYRNFSINGFEFDFEGVERDP
jgi:hypothetical protein